MLTTAGGVAYGFGGKLAPLLEKLSGGKLKIPLNFVALGLALLLNRPGLRGRALYRTIFSRPISSASCSRR
ncbi:MAG: hypothetical protein HC793_02380 [Aquincola sp.]|nr:hypothetical protein [Aquincola sp.]